jgi:hypothetical protein
MVFMITKIAITLLVLVFTGLALLAVWFKDSEPREGHNICLGYKAGDEITTESYQFRMRLDPNSPEYATTMSHKEWKYMKQVLDRVNQAEIDKHH